MNPTEKGTKGSVLVRALSPWKIIETSRFSLAGIRYALTSDSSFLQLIIAEFIVAVFLAGVLWPMSLTQIGVLAPAFALPIATELINVAIEEVVDLVSPGINEKAKNAKDCASGATFIATIVWLTVSLLVVVNHYV